MLLQSRRTKYDYLAKLVCELKFEKQISLPDISINWFSKNTFYIHSFTFAAKFWLTCSLNFRMEFFVRSFAKWIFVVGATIKNRHTRWENRLPKIFIRLENCLFFTTNEKIFFYLNGISWNLPTCIVRSFEFELFSLH